MPERIAYRTKIEPPIRVGNRTLRTVYDAVSWLDDHHSGVGLTPAKRGQCTKLADRLSPHTFDYETRCLPEDLRAALVAWISSR